MLSSSPKSPSSALPSVVVSGIFKSFLRDSDISTVIITKDFSGTFVCDALIVTSGNGTASPTVTIMTFPLVCWP